MSSGRGRDLAALVPVATLRPITPDSLFPKPAGARRGARGKRSGSGDGRGERELFS